MCKILFLVQPWIIPVDVDFRKVPRPPLYIGFFSAVHSCWQASRNGKKNLKNSWSAHKWYSRFSSHQKISFHHPEPGSGFKPVLRVSDEYTPWKAALIFFELSMVCNAISDNSLMTKNTKRIQIEDWVHLKCQGTDSWVLSNSCSATKWILQKILTQTPSWSRANSQRSSCTKAEHHHPYIHISASQAGRREVDKAMKTMIQSGFEPETFCV